MLPFKGTKLVPRSTYYRQEALGTSKMRGLLERQRSAPVFHMLQAPEPFWSPLADEAGGTTQARSEVSPGSTSGATAPLSLPNYSSYPPKFFMLLCLFPLPLLMVLCLFVCSCVLLLLVLHN